MATEQVKTKFPVAGPYIDEKVSTQLTDGQRKTIRLAARRNGRDR